MPRRARIVVPGCAHHVTQRGNRQANVFRDDEDRFHYMRLLRQHSANYGVDLWAYALMTNHIHTIVVPHSVNALAEVFRNAHSVYGLAADDIESEIKAIRKATAKDYPFAEDAFVKRLEAELGRPLRPQKVGRRRGRPKTKVDVAQGKLLFVKN